MKICNIEILGKGYVKIVRLLFCALRMLFALRNYGYGFHHVCRITGHIFSDMCGIMGPNF